MAFTAVKGMHDLLPPESAAWAEAEALIRAACARYGFHEIRTPILEKTPLFVRGVGETTAIVEKEMYTFTDQGEEQLTLRPEGTAAVVRAYIESGRAATDPLAKFFYFGPMFRRERPQKGRFRQFHQFGIEAFGSVHPYVDVEVMALLMRVLGAVGGARMQLEINSLGCAACRPAYLTVVQRLLGNAAADLCPDCRRRMAKNPLRVFDCKNSACRELLEDIPTIADYRCAACNAHFDEVRGGCDALHLPYQVNPRIARGLDYYVRTAFEVIADGLGAHNAVGGGGRYDGLVKALGGPDIPGVGVAVGMERLMLLADRQVRRPATPTVFLAAVDNLGRAHLLPLLEDLRAAGCAVEWDPDGRLLKSQMRRADKLGARLVVILGDDEVRAETAIVRDMQTKEQHSIPLKELTEYLTRLTKIPH
ncbi:MAG: histidine--tRNA ligase [Deltaproteobacteria bacterium]|nr:histidine--tRNA ligase [Deltaproteobacteria bacterium]